MRKSIALLVLLVASVSASGSLSLLESSVLSRSLGEVANLDTSSLTCATPENQFQQMNRELVAWGDIVQNKNKIPSDLKTLAEIAKMIQQSKRAIAKKQVALIEVKVSELGKIIDKKLAQLSLPKTQSHIGSPQLAEIRNELRNLSTHDPEEQKQCCERMMAILEFLIKQLQGLHAQCQANPVTVIKIRGKIKDLQIVHSGCCNGCDTTQQIIGKPKKNPPQHSHEDVPGPEPSEHPENPDSETTPTESEPTPSEPTPSEPTPSEPTPSEPTPSEPTPSEPTPSESTPSEPENPETESTPTESTPTEPETPVTITEPSEPETPSSEEPGTVPETPETPSSETTPSVPEESEDTIPDLPDLPYPEETPEDYTSSYEVPPYEPYYPSEEEGFPPSEHPIHSEPSSYTEYFEEEGSVFEFHPPSDPHSVGYHPHSEEGTEFYPPDPETREVSEETYTDVLVPPTPPYYPSPEESEPSEPTHPTPHVVGEEEGIEFPPYSPEFPPQSEEEGYVPDIPIEFTTDPEPETVPEWSIPEEEESVPEVDGPLTCVQGDSSVYVASVGSTDPISVQETEGDFKSYGFGFYFRWLQYYPEPLYQGVGDERFFLARVTENNPNRDTELGDRALAVFFSNLGLTFSTYDKEEENGLVFADVPLVHREGDWGYLYFQYHHASEKAYAFVQYPEEETIFVEIPAAHYEAGYLKFTVGGSDNTYRSFNGQVSGIQYYIDEHVVTSVEDFHTYVYSCNPPPQDDLCTEVLNHEYNDGVVQDVNPNTPYDAEKTVENALDVFAPEYSVSGWFKWAPTENQQVWHTGFRLSINDGEHNKNVGRLGDRVLGYWVGGPQTKNILAFATYSYEDLKGTGNGNDWQAIPYEQDLTEWHYVYFGYSRITHQAYGYVKFGTREAQVSFGNVYHYLAAKYYLNVGQDQFYASYSGVIQQLFLNMCQGAFKTHGWDEPFGRYPDPLAPPPPTPEVPVPEEPPAKKCDDVIQITVDNAADVLCALGEFNQQVMNGAVIDPDTGAKICFCLEYNGESANPDLLALAEVSHKEISSAPQRSALKRLLAQRKIIRH